MRFKRVRVKGFTDLTQEYKDRLPELVFYNHDYYDINILNSSLDERGNLKYTYTINNTVLTTTCPEYDILPKLIHTLPLSMKHVMHFTDPPTAVGYDSLLDDIKNTCKDMLSKDDREWSVFLHKKYFKILEELNIPDPDKKMEVYVIQKVLQGLDTELDYTTIKSRLEDLFNEIATIGDVEMQKSLNYKKMSPLLGFLIYDYIFGCTFSYNLERAKVFNEVIFALSRNMFYLTKMENVLGILNKNMASYGPLMWLMFSLIEDDVNNNTTKNQFKIVGDVSYHQESLQKSLLKLLNELFDYSEKFDRKAFSESFIGMSETQFSQVTGLYLTNSIPTGPSASISMRDNAIPTVSLNMSNDSSVSNGQIEQNIRQTNYIKIAKRISTLEDECLSIRDVEHKQSLIEDAKYIMSEIYAEKRKDEDGYPEMDLLLDRLQNVITEINNCIFGDEKIPVAEGLGKMVMKIPTAIIDMFKSLPNYKTGPNSKDNERAKKSMLFDRFFMRIEEIVDKTIPKGFKIDWFIFDGNRSYNDHLAKKALRKQNFRKAYERRREERGYKKEYAEDGIAGMCVYGNLIAKSEDFNDVTRGVKAFGKGVADTSRMVASGAKTVYKGARDAWRILVIKKAFNEARTAIIYLQKNHTPDDYDVDRVAMDHIRYWEKLCERLEDEDTDNPIIKTIRSELSKFRKMLSTNRPKNNNGVERTLGISENFKSYGESLVEELDEEDPTEVVEEVIEDDSINDEEKEDAIKELEDKILKKLTDKGALGDKDNPNAIGEGFLDLFKQKNDQELLEELQAILEGVEEKLVKEKNSRAKLRYEEIRAALKMKLESAKLKEVKDLKIKWKPNVPYLVFHKGKTMFGKMISLGTFCPFSHVDIVINGKAYTADESGIGEYELKPWSEIVVYELTDKVDVKRLYKYIHETLGNPYGYFRLLKAQIFGLPTKASKDKLDSFFCSHWVTSALDKATRMILKFRDKDIKDLGYDAFSPKLLFNFMVNSKGLVKSTNSLTGDQKPTEGE